MMSNLESSSAGSGSDMSSVSSESEEDDTVNFIDTSNEDDSNSEVETERSCTCSRSPIKRPLDISRSTEITPVEVVIADSEGGHNAGSPVQLLEVAELSFS